MCEWFVKFHRRGGLVVQKVHKYLGIEHPQTKMRGFEIESTTASELSVGGVEYSVKESCSFEAFLNAGGSQ